MTAAAPAPRDFAAWREAARALLAGNVAPEDVPWSEASSPSLFDAPPPSPSTAAGDVRIPRKLVALLEAAACHADAARWSLMYRVLWRVTHGERHLVQDAADADMARLRAMAKAVDREVHHMHAFVRFRERRGAEGLPRFEAWFEPEHDILHRAAPFFRDRFAGMHWIIATPRGAAAWDGRELAFLEGPLQRPADDADDREDLWRIYYASVFNPARRNAAGMRQHMPQRYWKNLPEAHAIARLEHVAAPLEAPAPAAPAWADRVHGPVAEATSLDACRRCPLYERATQAVPGEGPGRPRVMIVGEQPGDDEDLRGKPFVGPAGQVLDRALAAAGIARDTVYLTNAVKHFKWEPRGKRRLHKTPAQREIEACGAWLEGEIAGRRPQVLVALGATAAFALTGEKRGIAASRGETIPHRSGVPIVVTYHPSAVLRAREEGDAIFGALVADLRRADTM